MLASAREGERALLVLRYMPNETVHKLEINNKDVKSPPLTENPRSNLGL